MRPTLARRPYDGMTINKLNPPKSGGLDGCSVYRATSILLDALGSCPLDGIRVEQAHHLIGAGVRTVSAHRIVEVGVDTMHGELLAKELDQLVSGL